MQKKHLMWPHELNVTNKENKFIWSPKQLYESFFPLIEDLISVPSSYAFRNEVDPDAMGIPEYRIIIKKPMALKTISENILSGSYQDPWDIVNDIWLIFDNAMLFNKPSTNIYKECVKLMDIFKEKINSLMSKLGFCCGMKYSFEPQTLACNLCDPNNPSCAIWKEDSYYYMKDKDEEGIQICKLCFEKSSDSFIIQNEKPKLCQKDQFEVLKNNVLTEESFISCSKCCRKWHNICALHISTPDNLFLCNLCKLTPKIAQKEFSAERIPSTDLSDYIEKRLNEKFLFESENVNKVVIRVLADSSATVQVKPEIIEKYQDCRVSVLPYRAKAIYAFQKIDGYDIVFFALYTQEYGEDCPAPNTRRVYVSYIDSVHYFRPREKRTEVYHEILISYLDYCRRQQYLTAHLWSCPPGSGDDYVFHQHPVEQKVPKRNRLINWYKKLLDKAVLDDVVIEYMNIHEFVLENNISNPIDIPYFEGDFWPNAIAEMISNDGKESVSAVRKRKTNKVVESSTKDLRTKMLQLTKKFNEEFLVIVLNKKEDISYFVEKSAKSFSLRNTSLFEVRDSILYFCREYNLEFSTLRRAKFTTMRILDELFRDNQKELFDCDVCKKSNLSDRYTCTECLDFDLCPVCYEKRGHVHKMTRVFQNSSEMRLQTMLNLLNEAVRCKECRKSGCVMMKRLLVHAQRCTLSYENCSDCYKYTVLMVHHAHYCRDTKCRIMFCREKREKDKRRESQILLKRRYNEIHRYQATKQSFEIEDTKMISENLSIVPFEELTRVAKIFFTNYSSSEWISQFNIFLEANPHYKAASDLYTQRKIQIKCTQLEGKLKSEENELTLSDQSKVTVKPEQVEKVNKRSSYFVKSVNDNNALNTSYKIKPIVKPEPKKSEPLAQQNFRPNQSTTKKRVLISNQN